jgi:hypothetical protein
LLQRKAVVQHTRCQGANSKHQRNTNKNIAHMKQTSVEG